MTIRKQNKLLQVDERETFKVRKSKKYKNLCSFAFGVLAISGLAAAPASADEVVAITDTTLIAVTESVVESPAPSTNLIEAQPEATVEAVQQQETVGQQAGEIAVVNASDDLNTAVATAQQEGVKVVPEEPKYYGVTTSVEETAAKQEEIQKDYARQAEVINKATEAYVEAKESYEKETSKINEENNNLKAEYEAEVAKVNAENEAIRLRNSKAQEAYDKAMDIYESDLAKYEAAVAEAQANTTKIGYASEVITQALLFDSEPNADYTVSGTVKLVKENDESRTYSLNKGETIVVTYTGLQNSTYDGTELSKVVYSYTAKSDNVNLYILKDPTLTVVLQPNNSATTSGESRVNLKAEFYDKDGNVIEFSEEKPAVISLSSLNRNSVYDGVGLGEAVAITSNNSDFVSINGSTITQNGNVISSSILDNHNRSFGSKYDANNDGVNVTDGNPNNYWDNEASPLRYYGAGLLKVTSGTSIEIDIFRNWENSEIAHTGDYYFGFNTKVGTSSELIPTAPNEPTLKLEEELEYPKEPTYKELPEVPEVPTVSYRLAILIEPLKANTNAKGVNINGKVVPIGGTNYYTITLDYDQYADIEVDAETILKGFGAFDDYPEEALTVDLSRATIIDSDGQVVTGFMLKDNSSVSSVDDSTKALLSSSQIDGKIKGAFISIVADDPISYYQNIIKAKKSVTITIPMTVKDSLYNTGQSYSNTAYQVDFGNGYVTNTVTNSTPVVTPTKNNTNSEGVIINGKPVLANSVNYYKVVLDYSAYEGIEADEELVAQGFFAVDDYPEEALIVETTGIQLQDSDNSIPKGVTTTVYTSLSEAPEAVQTAMAKQGFTPKGAITVLSADDPKEFYETYVKTGKTITATLPMTVKAELAKTGGTYENTAYQVDFGTAYVTDTVINNVPKLDPKKDVVIDLTHSNESLNDQDIEVGTVFNYKISGAEIPADRGSKITSYTWLDVLDERDQYDGVHKIYAPVVFNLKNGTVIEKGTELTRFAIQSYDVETRRVYTALDEEFLAQISDLSAFTADLYLQVKRVGTGVVENTAIHAVNESEVSTNTVVTHTPVGNVIVRYFEEGTGLVLKHQVIDEDGVATGTDYGTTDRKVDRIVTEDGKTYQLVRHEGSETGKVVKGDTIVDYFYEEVKADVLVHYIDEDGNVIAETVKDTDQGSTGTAYDTTDHKPEYITVDGVRYKLMSKKTIGEETGILTEDGAEVTYVYHKIVTNWVEEGTNKVLKDREDGEHERGEIPDYDYVETIVDEETGDITHIFKQVSKPVETKTETPTVTPTVATKAVESTPVVKQAAVTSLPNTGDASGGVAAIAGAMSTVFGLVGIAKRKKED